jgi:formylglycine-generating enzyme required for sulfatase activity
MLGNVAEVCLDWYAPVDSAAHTGVDPVGPRLENAGARKRVARGGSAWHDATGTVCSRRDQAGHDEISSLYGFRLAIILEPMR